MKKCIILANGKPPPGKVFSFLKTENYSTLICADGGANYARKLNITPDYIVGDFDSITADTLRYFRKKSELIKISGQNDTDVEKCLKLAISRKYSVAVLLGVTGNRLDHTFCNLGIVIKYYKKISLGIIAEHSFLIPYSGEVELKTRPGETISIYAFDRKTKITSSGLRYPLKNSLLPFGEKESTSNVAAGDKINLKIRGGIIFLIRDFKTVMKNDLF